MNIYDKYEPVIGLEIHAQLLTNTKAFSSDAAEYGASPNTLVSPVSLGHPGTLPVLNEKAVEFAIKLGLACNCTINYYNSFSRKNYFYADLPKGYQITQFNTPICANGFININGMRDEEKYEKKIGITRIHLEEDAGKSIHEQDPYYTLIDLNRAGVALLEMVSEPDIRTPDEAYQYVTEMRKLVRYLGICDGNMEEGSLRCDANVSVRLKKTEKFGQKVEVKNINSIRNVRRALEYEIKRQIEAIEKGEIIEQDTRSFDAVKGTTFTMRSKESVHDYRYFTEPDLPPLILTDDYVQEVKSQMPALPNELRNKFIIEFGLSEYDAAVLTDDKEVAFYFEEIIHHTKNFKAAANWVLGPVKSYLNEYAMGIKDFALQPVQIAELVGLIDKGKISFSSASQKLFPELTKQKKKTAFDLATEQNLIQQSDTELIKELVHQALSKYPEKVAEYKSGKQGLTGLFMGEVMKLSKGKADPKVANQLLLEELNK